MRVNIPRLTRILLITLFALSVLDRIVVSGIDLGPFVGGPAAKAWQTPIANSAIGRLLFYPWVILTSTFVEGNIVTLLITGATLFYGGKYLERAWGSEDFAKFVLIVASVPNLLMVILCLLVGDHTVQYVFAGTAKNRSSSLLTACSQISVYCERRGSAAGGLPRRFQATSAGAYGDHRKGNP